MRIAIALLFLLAVSVHAQSVSFPGPGMPATSGGGGGGPTVAHFLANGHYSSGARTTETITLNWTTVAGHYIGLLFQGGTVGTSGHTEICTDTEGNTWTEKSRVNVAGQGVGVFASSALIGGTVNDTIACGFSDSTTSGFTAIEAVDIAGSTGLELGNTFSNGTATTTQTSGGITTTHADLVIVFDVPSTSWPGGSLAINTPFTDVDHQYSAFSMDTAKDLQSSAGTVTATWATDSQQSAGGYLAFKP